MFSLSSYFSIEYLVILLPISVGLYAVLPQKLRRMSLLLSSYVFFWAVSGKLIAYLLLSTLSIHHIGIWLSSIQGDCDRLMESSPKANRKEIKNRYLKRQRLVVAFAVALHIGVLLVLKYTPFFTSNLNTLFRLLNLPLSLTIPSFVLPIGISFYTMQAVAYIFDVYRRKIPPIAIYCVWHSLWDFSRKSWKAQSAAILKRLSSCGRPRCCAIRTLHLACKGFFLDS